MSAQVGRHVIAHGRVQGVGYRAFVEEEAKKRGLHGWVRNRRDGTVEALFVGAASDVGSMIAACRRGPRSAHVLRVDERAGSDADLALCTDAPFAVLPTP